MTRACYICGTAIDQCFGCVMAGDMLLALSGQLAPERVREQCGTCASRIIMRREGERGRVLQMMQAVMDLWRGVEWRLSKLVRPKRYPLLWPVP